MGLKRVLVGVATTAWLVLVVGGVAAVYTGTAEPYLSPADVPVGSQAAFLGMLVLAAAGLVAGQFLRQRLKGDEWLAAGRRAGFEPTGSGGFAGAADLTGTVDGRPVDARLVEHAVNSDEGNPSTVRYTYVETGLDGVTDDGAVVGGDWGVVDGERGSIHFDEMVANVDAAGELVGATAGDLSVVGTSAGVTRALATGRPEEALRSLDGLNLAYVGDASRVVADYAEARNADLEGSVLEFPVEELVEAVPGDAWTATIETRAWIRDGDELRRQAEAVVALAAAFEGATGGGPSAG